MMQNIYLYLLLLFINRELHREFSVWKNIIHANNAEKMKHPCAECTDETKE